MTRRRNSSGPLCASALGMSAWSVDGSPSACSRSPSEPSLPRASFAISSIRCASRLRPLRRALAERFELLLGPLHLGLELLLRLVELLLRVVVARREERPALARRRALRFFQRLQRVAAAGDGVRGVAVLQGARHLL